MAITEQTKDKINRLIYERAYEIENMLAEDNFFMAKLVGLKPEQVGEASLTIAIKELQKEFSN